MYYWDNKVVLDDDLYAQRVRWGPLVTPGVSLVGVAQSEVGINSNSTCSLPHGGGPMAAGPASRSGSSTRGQNRAAALTLLAPSTLDLALARWSKTESGKRPNRKQN